MYWGSKLNGSRGDNTYDIMYWGSKLNGSRGDNTYDIMYWGSKLNKSRGDNTYDIMYWGSKLKRSRGDYFYEKFSEAASWTSCCCCFLLAHLSRRLRGELLVHQWLRRPSSVVRRPSSVNIFKHLLLWNHWANWTQISYGDSLGWGTKVCSNVPGHVTKKAAMPIYGKNPLKIFFSRTRRPMTLGPGM